MPNEALLFLYLMSISNIAMAYDYSAAKTVTDLSREMVGVVGEGRETRRSALELGHGSVSEPTPKQALLPIVRLDLIDPRNLKGNEWVQRRYVECGVGYKFELDSSMLDSEHDSFPSIVRRAFFSSGSAGLTPTSYRSPAPSDPDSIERHLEFYNGLSPHIDVTRVDLESASEKLDQLSNISTATLVVLPSTGACREIVVDNQRIVVAIIEIVLEPADVFHKQGLIMMRKIKNGQSSGSR